MRSYMDLSIRQKLQTIVMATSAAALLVASVVFALFDRSTFLRAKTQDLSAAAKMVGSNSTAALSFGDAQSAGEILSALQAKQNVIHACIYNKDGEVFASYSRDAARQRFLSSPGANPVHCDRRGKHGPVSTHHPEWQIHWDDFHRGGSSGPPCASHQVPGD